MYTLHRHMYLHLQIQNFKKMFLRLRSVRMGLSSFCVLCKKISKGELCAKIYWVSQSDWLSTIVKGTVAKEIVFLPRCLYTVKRVDEVVWHPHLVTQDQNTQVSNKVSDIAKENFTITSELFRHFSQVSN